MEDLQLNNAVDPFNAKFDVRFRTHVSFDGVIDISAV
jgi:hypothetical protein